MTLQEFFHVGYQRWGLRASVCTGKATYEMKVLNIYKHTKHTSEQVWEFGQWAEYILNELIAETESRG